MATRTKGNVIVEEINVGDIHYEYDMGMGIKCKVVTKPEFSEMSGGWEWESENIKTGKIIVPTVFSLLNLIDRPTACTISI